MKFSPILFAAGIIIAICGGAQLPAKGNDWPASVPIFAVGAVIAIVGLVLWRKQQAAARKALAQGGEGAQKGPLEYLRELIAPAKKLQDDLDSLTAPQTCDRIDELLESYVLPFAQVRQQVVDRMGMTTGAELLVTVAYGERMLNRVWSAAGDGHLPEARSVYGDAVSAFEEAVTIIEKSGA